VTHITADNVSNDTLATSTAASLAAFSSCFLCRSSCQQPAFALIRTTQNNRLHKQFYQTLISTFSTILTRTYFVTRCHAITNMTARCAKYMSVLKIVCKHKSSQRLRKNLHITILSLVGGQIIFEVFQQM